MRFQCLKITRNRKLYKRADEAIIELANSDSIVATLDKDLRARLEKKGCLSSEFGESTAMRGGKRKRFFKVTKYGQKVLSETRAQRQQLWEAIPRAAFE